MYSIIKIVYKDEDGNYFDHKYAKTKLSQKEINAVTPDNMDIIFIGYAGESVCNGLTDSEKETIAQNLSAYTNNFDYIKIEKQGKEFYIYAKEDAEYDDYIQRCPNINYVNGWLYGAVQANNKTMRSIR